MLYSGLTVTNYTVKSDKVNEKTLKIVLISDLHSTIYDDNQNALIEKIAAQSPDLIFLTGDIADDVVPIEGTKLMLEGIKNLAPIYYVAGNHEYWSNDIQSIRDEISEYGVTIISDEYVMTEINGISLLIAGADDPSKKYYEDESYNHAESMKNAFSSIDEIDAYRILLAHRPSRIDEYSKYPFDLVLSGHAHGGQVRIPIFLENGLFAPDEKWFPKYTSTTYYHGDLVHVVSRGLSINPRLPRVFNPPEIVVITITK